MPPLRPARWLVAVVLAGCEAEPVVIAPDATALDVPAADRADAPDVAVTPDVAVAPDAAAPTDIAAPDAPQCPAGQSFCDGRCLDTAADPMNCGVCGLRCPASTPSCMCGACFGSCAPGLLTCCRGVGGGAVCADPRASDEHCGRCGNRCVSGERCVDGACESTLADCDPAHAACDARPPTCPAGQFPSVRMGCWGPCVAFERCLPIPCPDAGACPNGWRCVASILTCQP
ncbi:MAG: hypothetical protein U0324_04820 [Polyangiales bacterium]